MLGLLQHQRPDMPISIQGWAEGCVHCCINAAAGAGELSCQHDKPGKPEKLATVLLQVLQKAQLLAQLVRTKYLERLAATAAVHGVQ